MLNNKMKRMEENIPLADFRFTFSYIQQRGLFMMCVFLIRSHIKAKRFHLFDGTVEKLCFWA